MRPWKLIALLLILAPGILAAKDKTKKRPNLPVIFQSAHFVYVESPEGDVMRPGVYPADRNAVLDVEDGIRDWKRYVLTTRRENADLVIVVRKGRIAGAQPRGGVQVGAPRQPNQLPGHDPSQAEGDSVGAEAEIGPEDDMLRVFTLSSEGKLSNPVWSRELKDGLARPSVPLLQQLKDEVERAYPPAPPAQPAPPTQTSQP